MAHQQKENFCLSKVLFLFIQAAGLAYHHRTTYGAYHQPLWGCISSRASAHLTGGICAVAVACLLHRGLSKKKIEKA